MSQVMYLNKNKPRKKEISLLVLKSGEWEEGIGRRWSEGKTSSYKVSKYQGCNVHYDNHS